MTFQSIVSEVCERMNLTSADATARVGAAVNRHYRRITSLLGMETTRFVSRDLAMSVGVATVTFTQIEKIDRVFDITQAERRLLPEISLHQLRVLQPGTGAPTQWALQNTGANTVTILTDTVPTTAWALRVDGWTSLSTLTGTDEPVFPASFHDVLTWFALSEELLRKEKLQLAQTYGQQAEGLLSDLRFHLADTHTRELRQASHAGGPGSGLGGPGSGSGSGGGVPGGASYLINLPESTLVGRGSGQGTGISQTITLGVGLDLIGTALHAKGAQGAFVDVVPTPVANQLALFSDADTLKGDTRLAMNPTTGGLLLNSSQLVFPTPSILSTGVTTLDDYREGSFTPSIGSTGGESGQTYFTQLGRYVKFGKFVQCTVHLALSTLGTLQFDLVVKGFPFLSESLSNFYYVSTPIVFLNLNAPYISLVGRMSAGANHCDVLGLTVAAAAYGNVPVTAITSSVILTFQLSYQTAS